MEKLILKNGTELSIESGGSIGNITVLLGSYEELGQFAGHMTADNISEVKFTSNDLVGGDYDKMTLITPHYRVTQIEDGTLQVVFGLRKKTQEELQQDDVQAAITYLSDEQALTVPALYPEWSPAGTYAAGDRYRCNGALYKCLQDHAAEPNWSPEAAPSLWAPLLIVDDAILEWQQPDSTNGYSTGDKVAHDGNTWESLVDDNVWEPGAEGTESLWREVE